MADDEPRTKPDPADRPPLVRIRRRDTAAVAALGSVVIAMFWIFGEIGFVQAMAASATIAALSVFYYLTVSTTLNSAPRAEPDAATPGRRPPPADPKQMLETLPIPVLLIGTSGRIELANPAAREFLGLGSAEGHLSAVLRQPHVLEAVAGALRGQEAEPVEYSVTVPVESHVRAFIAPLSVPDGAVPAWRAMLVLSDETSIKRLNRMRADFLANASHELRTPLSSLAGFVETLRGHAREDPEARDRFLAIMLEQTERMQRLINDLLSLSRIEMDEHVPPAGTVELAGLVDETIATLKPQIEERSVRVEVDFPAEARATGDRDQLTEVVINLLENAVKYSPEGGQVLVRVEAGLSRDQAERPERVLGEAANRLTLAAPVSEPRELYVAIRIQDSGQGIERRDLPRLAERFYRVGGQKSGAKEGTGLGLAIVKHIVNRHRGGFTVESAPGSGSVFSVFLPAAKERKAGAEGRKANGV